MLQELILDLSSRAAWLLFIVGCLIGWRLWTFTLRPLIWSSQPKELPYWIPGLGHTVSFFRNYVQLIENGLNSTGRTFEPFCIQLLGQKLYICTAPSDVSTVFDNNTHFNFDSHLTNLLTSFGISKEALERAWHKPQPGDWCYIPNNPINPKQQSLIHCVEDIYRQQLLPGELMDQWAKGFLDSAHESLSSIDNLEFCTGIYESGVSYDNRPLRQISLYSMVSYFSIEATMQAMFGPHLADIDHSVVDHMVAFNEHVWMIVFRCPNVIGLPVDEPQGKLMAIMRKFVQTPKHMRRRTSWAIGNVLDGMDIAGMDVESKASMILMMFWAAVSNEHNSCFWLITHLLYDDSLLDLARTETEAAWRDGQLDIKYLCANSPNLDAIFNEVLRLNNTAAAVRAASSTTTVSGKVIPEGSLVVLPFRQLHTNENVWGPTVNQFEPFRFLKKKSLTRHSSFRPFGGGATLCPGQTLARHEVFGFLAILLHRYHLTVAKDFSGQKHPSPKLNSMAPSFGLNGPVKGMDVLVDICTRE